MTSYTYSVLGNLLTVTQGVQTRTFTYDSLSRLRTAANPESGTISYQYDDNSNLLVKTDARGVSAHYAYDALNRAGRRWYNGSSLLTSTTNNSPTLPTGVGATDEVKYFYDTQTLPAGAPAFDRGYATGRLVGVTYGTGSAGTYHGYDARGAVLRQYQQTDAVNYLAEAAYSLNGSMQSQTYPSVPGAGDRRTVSYTNDNAGRLASLSSPATSYAPAASVNSIGYSAPGGLSSETYGNNLIHAVTYNSRLQTNEIKLGTSGAPASNVSITYNYGTTANNGNLQSTSYAGGGLSYTQTFGYDELNRLTTSQEGASWSQTNTYDRYGNRSVTVGGLSFTASNNRITGWSYDAAGNLLNDGGHGYTFDAESKISKVDNVASYVYDGEGQRVRKLINENLRFVYGIGGQQIAEFDGSSGVLKKEYIYGASGLLATIEPTAVNANGTRYTTSDQLGTPRMVADKTGSLAGIKRHDYLPFGEELLAGHGSRTLASGYSGDNVRQKFTSHERDIETALDYKQARYFNNQAGRFISADTVAGSTASPQTLNLYAYVANNPLRYTDPTGHRLSDIGVYQTDDAQNAHFAEQQSLDNLRSANEHYQQRQDPTGSLHEGGHALPQNPRNPTDFRRDIFDRFEAAINLCIGEIFGTTAKKIPTQSLNNAPDLDVSVSGRDLGKRSSVSGAYRSIMALPDPNKGKNGTVFIQSGSWNYPKYPLDVLQGAYLHEYGNILSFKYGDGNFNKFGDKAGIGKDFKDKDTGANFQRCVFPSSIKW